MALATVIYNGTGNGTSSVLKTERKKDDTGMWMIQFTPNSAPATVTCKLQVRIHPNFSGFATISTATESEIGSTSGVKYWAEQIPLAREMRVVVSNNDDAANALIIAIQE
jgi:hypothetical protein